MPWPCTAMRNPTQPADRHRVRAGDPPVDPLPPLNGRTPDSRTPAPTPWRPGRCLRRWHGSMGDGTAHPSRRGGGRPLRPCGGAHQHSAQVGRTGPERVPRAAVVEHLGDVRDLDRRSDVTPQPVVTVPDLGLGNRVPVPTYALSHALHREVDRHQDHVEVHEVPQRRGVSHERDLAGVEEHGLGDEGLTRRHPGSPLGLRDPSGFVGVRSLGVGPSLGPDHVGVDERQPSARRQHIADVRRLPGAVRTSEQVQQRHQPRAR